MFPTVAFFFLGLPIAIAKSIVWIVAGLLYRKVYSIHRRLPSVCQKYISCQPTWFLATFHTHSYTLDDVCESGWFLRLYLWVTVLTLTLIELSSFGNQYLATTTTCSCISDREHRNGSVLLHRTCNKMTQNVIQSPSSLINLFQG